MTVHWIGQRLKRREDPELLTGAGQHIADVTRPGLLHAAFLRSPYAHARIRSIDTARARELRGVHALLTGDDLPPDLAPQPQVHLFAGQRATPYYALARGCVRYAGEPVAVVAAQSRYIAEDALALIRVDWESLPVAGASGASSTSTPKR